MAATKLVCGRCERIIEDDEEKKQDDAGNPLCPTCGGKLQDEEEAGREYADGEAWYKAHPDEQQGAENGKEA
jgi:DNA-directed RNA polymerase subunit RPC12/RpoP